MSIYVPKPSSNTVYLAEIHDYLGSYDWIAKADGDE